MAPTTRHLGPTRTRGGLAAKTGPATGRWLPLSLKRPRRGGTQVPVYVVRHLQGYCGTRDPESRGRVCPVTRDDIAQVTACVETFFDAFATGPGLDERMAALAASFLREATIAHFTAEGELVVDEVAGFIEPRHAYLAGEAVTEFREWPLPGEVRVLGDLAVWSGAYAKEGHGPDGRFAGSGAKVIQLVRLDGRWRIAHVAWQDDPQGAQSG